MNNKIIFLVLISIIILLVAIGSIIVFIYTFSLPPVNPPNIPISGPQQTDQIKKFESEDDFQDYLNKAEKTAVNQYFSGFKTRTMPTDMLEQTAPMPAADDAGQGSGAERFSETNVQVAGIDEPDIVKTNGQKIYFSSDNPVFFDEPLIRSESSRPQSDDIFETQPLIMPADEPPFDPGRMPAKPGTRLVNAFPPADLELDSAIQETGNLLLVDDILVIFTYDEIFGYDISDAKNPEQLWRLDYETRNTYIDARLFNEKIYLITRSYIDFSRPCPIKPMRGNTIEIACTDIYYPGRVVPVDVTYNIMEINPQTGNIDNASAFTGSSENSELYMSNNAIYLTYFYTANVLEFFYNFLVENNDLFPQTIINKVSNLLQYDISDSSKLTELGIIMEDYLKTLDDDQILKFENELNNRMDDFAQENARDLERSGIIKLNINDLQLAASTDIPGKILNQFSIDEYQNNLRVATTTGSRGSLIWSSGITKSVNDVYVLDSNLNQLGSVLDMGITERIYSARFIGDKGYVVTFRETDPFYVLDLSNPNKPALAGELKIPGYSSYLHPISQDLILGIGEENSQVKLSLFDVSDPQNPAEKDKYQLKEYWTEVSSTHHAFLLDDKYEIFFLPAGNNAFIFSYNNDQLELIRAVSDIIAQRAVFINDYLYIIGDDKIAVLNETDWTEVNDLDF